MNLEPMRFNIQTLELMVNLKDTASSVHRIIFESVFYNTLNIHRFLIS